MLLDSWIQIELYFYTTLFPCFATKKICISSFCVKTSYCDVVLCVLVYVFCVQFILNDETCSPITLLALALSGLHSIILYCTRSINYS
jgi:hypothetical protein